MSDLITVLLVGLVGFSAVAFLLMKAKKAARAEKATEEYGASRVAQIRAVWKDASHYAYYAEHLNNLNQFFDAVYANEEGSPIQRYYASLDKIGVGELVPLIKTGQKAHSAFHGVADELDYEEDASTIEKIEQVFSAQMAEVRKKMQNTGISVLAALNEYRKLHLDVLGAENAFDLGEVER